MFYPKFQPLIKHNSYVPYTTVHKRICRIGLGFPIVDVAPPITT